MCFFEYLKCIYSSGYIGDQLLSDFISIPMLGYTLAAKVKDHMTSLGAMVSSVYTAVLL